MRILWRNWLHYRMYSSDSLAALPPSLVYLISLLRDDDAFLSTYENATKPLPTERCDDLLETAYAHGMTLLLDRNELRSEPCRRRLTSQRKKAVLHRMSLLSEWKRLCRLFRTHRLDILSIKGPALSLQAYGDIMVRHYSDLDFSLSPHILPSVLSLLYAEGYKSLNDFEMRDMRRHIGRFNDVALYHSEKEILIELHIAPFPKNFALDFDNTLLHDGGDTLSYEEIVCTLPSVDSHLLYLSVHGAKHLFERLAWVHDIHALTTRHRDTIDYDKLLETSRKHGIRRHFLSALYLSRTLFRTPLPDRVLAQIADDATIEKIGAAYLRSLGGDALPSFHKARLYLNTWWSLHETPRRKMAFLLLSATLPRRDDIDFVTLPKALYPLYPAVRFLRLTTKYLVSPLYRRIRR